MGLKEHAEELPLNYTTWVQFWDEIEAKGLHKTHETVMVVQPFNSLPKQQDKSYKVQYIKDRAFEELLSERMKRNEVINFTNELDFELFKAGFRERSPLLETLRTVKRILLTQSKK